MLQIANPIENISDQINEVFQYGSQRQMFLLNEHQLDISDFEFKLQEILPALETARMISKSQENIQNIVRS